jgi:hypothetical protein
MEARMRIILKYFAAILISILICPGLGHLFIKQFKKGLLIIGAMIFTIIFATLSLLSSEGAGAIPQNYELMKEYAAALLSKDTKSMLALDIIVAAIYSYALVDLAFEFIREIKKSRGQK